MNRPEFRTDQSTYTGEARAALADARALLLDWDGCIAVGNRPTPAALAFLRAERRRVAILSNNSTNLPEEFSDILAKAGVDVPPERIILAGAEAIALAASDAPAPTLVLGDSRIRARAKALGMQLSNVDAELVVLLRDRRFSYARLERAANAVARNAQLIVSNPDTSHPGPDGFIVPETGALLAGLLACVDVKPEKMRIVGKPGPDLFLKACAALNTAPADTIMIGDNPETDVLGANAVGMRSILLAEGGLTFDELAGAPEHTADKQLLRSA